MITEQILKYVFPENDIIFDKKLSILNIKYPKNNFDEKGYPKGINISYYQIIQLVKYNEGESIKFAMSSQEFIYQLRFRIESLYLANNGLDFINKNYVEKGFNYCPFSNTMSKYIEPMGSYKELFNSDEIILLKAHIQSDRINCKFVAYQLNYY